MVCIFCTSPKSLTFDVSLCRSCTCCHDIDLITIHLMRWRGRVSSPTTIQTCRLQSPLSALLSQYRQTVETDAYASIIVPPDNRVYHQLAQLSKEVVSLGASGSAAYVRTVAAFNHLLSFRPGSAGIASQSLGNAIIRPPLPKSATKKRGRPNNEDLVNRSALTRKQSTSSKQRKCSACASQGVTATDHRKGGKCPYSNYLVRTEAQTLAVSASSYIARDE